MPTTATALAYQRIGLNPPRPHPTPPAVSGKGGMWSSRSIIVAGAQALHGVAVQVPHRVAHRMVVRVDTYEPLSSCPADESAQRSRGIASMKRRASKPWFRPHA